MLNPPNGMFTTTQFAKKINVHPQTIRAWRRKGLLKPAMITPSGCCFYSQQQIDEYLAPTK